MAKTPYETIKFSSKEVNIMMFGLRFTSFETNQMTGTPNERRFAKTDELVALETFKELKKGIDDEKKSSKDCELILGTAQKALLITCINSIQWGLDDLEPKTTTIEKLEK